MTTRTILAAVAAVLVATLTATTVLAVSTLKDPKSLVLQKSDFPGGARLLKKYTAGASSKGGASYTATYQYKSGSKAREVQSDVIVSKNSSLATAGYRYFKSDVLKAATKLTLPKYGDEQFATYFFGEGELYVLKNTVIWGLTVRYDSDRLTKAEAIAELKRLAPKVMKRVGSG